VTDIQKQPHDVGLFLPPVLLLLLSGIGLLISLLLSVLFFMGGGVGLAGSSLPAESMTLLAMGWSALLFAGLFLPPLVKSIQQLSGKPGLPSQRSYFRLASLLMLLWLPLLLLGHWIATSGFLTWLFLPPLQVLLVAVPIFFLIEFARRKLTYPQDGGWGVFSLGVIVTQPLVILLEIIGLLAVGGLVIAWLSQRPDLIDELNRLAQRLMDAQMDPRVVEQILLPYLQQPAIVYLGLAIGAGLIPLLEELLKPLALWGMVGRRLDEPAGFVLGLFAGGTFALIESLGMAVSATEQDWSSILVARLGTGILHITTTALMGWALAAAWKNRKYMQLGLTLLIAFSLHAVWNLLGLFMGVQPYLPAASLPNLDPIVPPLALIVLAAAMLLILAGANRRLRKSIPVNPQGDEGAGFQPLSTQQNSGETRSALENIDNGSN